MKTFVLRSASPRRTAVLTAIGVGAAAAYLAGLGLGARPVQVAAKPIPVLCLALATGGGDRYAHAIRAGLVASLIGDLLLEGQGLFLAGLSLFLIAHLCYTAAFLTRSRQLGLGRALPFAAFGLAMRAVLGPGLGALAGPVSVYAAAISVMMWRASVAMGALPGTAARTGLAGAILFAISDALIGLDRFRTPIAGAPYAIILLYWAGQLGLALSVRAPVCTTIDRRCSTEG